MIRRNPRRGLAGTFPVEEHFDQVAGDRCEHDARELARGSVANPAARDPWEPTLNRVEAAAGRAG